MVSHHTSISLAPYLRVLFGSHSWNDSVGATEIPNTRLNQQPRLNKRDKVSEVSAKGRVIEKLQNVSGETEAQNF